MKIKTNCIESKKNFYAQAKGLWSYDYSENLNHFTLLYSSEYLIFDFYEKLHMNMIKF